jgi:uncharacterized protein (UPF0332 family)
MPFDPASFVDVATDLTQARHKPAEQHIRAACGRAYYAMFLVARERLTQAGFAPPSDRSVHAWVVKALSGASSTQLRTLGQLLGKMKKRRTDADYVLAGPYTDSSAFQLSYGVLQAAGAKRWIIEFDSIAIATLRAEAKPPP